MQITDCKEWQALAVSPDAGTTPVSMAGGAHIPLLTGHRCTQALLFLSCSFCGKEAKARRLTRLHCAQGGPNCVPWGKLWCFPKRFPPPWAVMEFAKDWSGNRFIKLIWANAMFPWFERCQVLLHRKKKPQNSLSLLQNYAKSICKCDVNLNLTWEKPKVHNRFAI